MYLLKGYVFFLALILVYMSLSYMLELLMLGKRKKKLLYVVKLSHRILNISLIIQVVVSSDFPQVSTCGFSQVVVIGSLRGEMTLVQERLCHPRKFMSSLLSCAECHFIF